MLPNDFRRVATAQGLVAGVQESGHESDGATTPPPPERRSTPNPSERLIGHIVSCDGARATIATAVTSIRAAQTDFWTIGRLISIATPQSRVVGMVFGMRTRSGEWREEEPNNLLIDVELVGEMQDGPDGTARFSRGIAVYPPLGAVAHRIRKSDLAAIHDKGQGPVVTIGELSQAPDIPATIHADHLLQRHFAVVGTTGTGKSSATTLIIREVLRAKPNLRVMILDPHNEFAAPLADLALIVDAADLELPFWLFRFEEFVQIIFRGRSPVPEECDVLREVIVSAKARYRQNASDLQTSSLLLRKPIGEGSFTADTPAPYRMADLIGAIDDMLGQLEPRYSKHDMRALRGKIESLLFDPRFRFMFGHMSDGDSMQRVIGTLFRIPANGLPVTVFQLSGIPSDVVDSVASVLARMAFDVALWGGGAYEILLVCEEAHRYIPNDPRLGFAPTRAAIARIAKEGRKYGCYLGIITQRPGELDPTILSQCSTVFAMRLANDRDQEIIRSAISDSSASTLTFLSAIGNREAIAFGEAVPTPMRMRFTEQPALLLPTTQSQNQRRNGGAADGGPNLRVIVDRMRGQAPGAGNWQP